MPGMALRTFECTLCEQSFTRMSGDLILPGPEICDDCIRDTWALEGEALQAHVEERLSQNPRLAEHLASPDGRAALVSSTAECILGLRRGFASADEALAERETWRGG